MEKNILTQKIICFGIAILAALTCYSFLPPDCSLPSRITASIFILTALFWAFELIPLYATSILAVLLLIFFLGKPDGILQFDKTGYQVFLVPFSSPVIILFFGGFALAKAMGKYELDQVIAKKLLGLFGSSPFFILLGFMLTTGFLSMWISNTATAAMMIGMIAPFLKNLDKTDPFSKAIPLSIAFGANIGGIGTPVGTPPNAIALGLLAENGIYVNFITWMKMAVPLAFILLIFTSFILYVLFPPKNKTLNFSLNSEASFSENSKWVLVIILGTVALWLTSSFHRIPEALIALTGAGILTATGLLDRNDIKNLDWDILILMWGGLALGKGIQISGLSSWILSLPLFDFEGFTLVIMFSTLAAILAMFISNTATANLIVPIALSIPDQNVTILAVTVALACSFGMVLPVSTPPNAIAFTIQTFSSRDMLKSGLLVCLLGLFIILIGYRFILIKLLQL